MRGWVCILQVLLDLASAVILGSESLGSHEHILLSQIRDCPNLEDQVPVILSPRNRVPQLYPQALGSLFVAFYDSQGYSENILTDLNAGILNQSQSQSQSYFTTGRLPSISSSWRHAP
jgi:hypothetical protein